MATVKQIGYAKAIVTEGHRLGVTERGIIIALATALVESNLTMYANRKVPESLKLPYDKIGDDGYSVGVMQQQIVKTPRGYWWADCATCMDITLSARLFYQRLVKLDYNNPKVSPGTFAQTVQDSRYPDRYDKRIAEATELYKSLDVPATEGTNMGWTGDPIWLADVLRDEGLTCDIFKDAASDAFGIGHGDFGGIWGVICHHTGSTPPGPGPRAIARHSTLGLASQLHLDRNGKYTLCGVGIAYHAGEGSWPGIAKNAANQVTIGIEAENNGTEGWTPVQYGAYVRGVGAILWRLGHGNDRAIGHKEWGAIQGKWDPGGIDMNAFRRDVEAYLAKKRNPEKPVPPVVVNEIDECAKRNPWVGARVRPEELPVGTDSKGRLGVYENAHIYFAQGVGAFAIPHGGLFEAYASYEYERGALGYPVRDFAPLDGKTGKGAVQAFQGGVLYRKDGSEKAYYIFGEIGKKWASEGYELGPLGWPLSNEFTDSNGNRVQLFENGSLYWNASSVVKLTRN